MGFPCKILRYNIINKASKQASKQASKIVKNHVVIAMFLSTYSIKP